ncbi:MAG: gene transfer agent family protein [Alphaproteobacteria bacterium]|nr:gene transfer agent family protein [Alphaproteobacteria bacterium]
MALSNWIWANRRRGDVAATINGQRRILRLTLAALARVESCYGDMDILALIRTFTTDGMTAKDADNIIRAALTGSDDEAANVLAHAETLSIAGADKEAHKAADLAHNLINNAFSIAQ